MRITSVNVAITAQIGNAVKAYASILIDNCMAIKNIRIIKRDKGYLMAMPSRKIGKNYDDITYPINAETRSYVEDKVMDAFWLEVKNQLDSIMLPTNYQLRYNPEDIHDLALIDKDNNKIIDKYTIDDYKSETLKELEEEIEEKLADIDG